MSKALPIPATPESDRAAASISLFRDRIRKAGLRSTLARIAVLQELEAATTPLTHADLADKLVPQGYDKATVYRNLMDLTRADMVSKSELGDHVYRFELRRPGSHKHEADHPHFLCVDCGKVSCLADVSVHITPEPGTKASPIWQLTEVLLKGRCDDCGK